MHNVLGVAIPWGLSHYIPLNGYHPLYRALIETRPSEIKVFSWSNIKSSKALKQHDDFLKILQESVKNLDEKTWPFNGELKNEYLE